MQTQREQLIAFHWGIKLSFSNSSDLLASGKIFSEQMQLTGLWFSVKWKLLNQLSCSFCKEQKTQIIEVLYTLGAVGVGKYSVLIIGLTREGNKSFLITSLVDDMFPHSNLSNCLLSWDFFVNEIFFAFLLLPFWGMCHSAGTHVCVLLASQQHFAAEDGGRFPQPSGILLLLPGEKHGQNGLSSAWSVYPAKHWLILCIWLVWLCIWLVLSFCFHI